MRVFSLDYMLRDLKTGENVLETEDDVCSSELAIAMEELLDRRIQLRSEKFTKLRPLVVALLSKR